MQPIGSRRPADIKTLENMLTAVCPIGAKKSFRTADAEPADLVIFAVKATALDSAIETARCVIGPDTAVISMMNGISSEEILGEAFGRERILFTKIVR